MLRRLEWTPLGDSQTGSWSTPLRLLVLSGRLRDNLSGLGLFSGRLPPMIIALAQARDARLRLFGLLEL